MPLHGHIDALLGSAWAWEDDEDDEHDGRGPDEERELGIEDRRGFGPS